MSLNFFSPKLVATLFVVCAPWMLPVSTC